MRRVAVAMAAVLLLSGCADQQSQPRSQTPSPSLSPSPTTTGASDGLPSESQWRSDVRTAMRGSQAYLDGQLAKAGGQRKLAVNLDIDNTALASQYDFGAPVPPVLAFARYAHRHEMAVLFNTARASGSDAGEVAARQLERAGYPVSELCLRGQGQDLVAAKQACRRHFVAEGYTIVANVGNNDTDFVGGDYERAFRLPNYGRLS